MIMIACCTSEYFMLTIWRLKKGNLLKRETNLIPVSKQTQGKSRVTRAIRVEFKRFTVQLPVVAKFKWEFLNYEG